MLTLADLKGSDYLVVDFYLTKSCNKSCHYCTAWTLEMRNLTVDMDFLRNILEYLSPYKTRICLLGGEPGLIKNLKEVIDENIINISNENIQTIKLYYDAYLEL